MRSLNETVKSVIEIARRPVTNERDFSESTITIVLQGLIDDSLRMAKNIRETSLNEKDKLQRAIELEKKYGIPKTYVI